VEGRLNCQGPYRFFFDTGADIAAIDAALAKKQDFPVIGEIRVMSGGDDSVKKPISWRGWVSRPHR
jgi:hypothetical protein